MEDFKFHIVKMTMLKSNKIVNLFYEKKSRLFLGFGFESEPVPLHVMLKLVSPYFPPDFELIGTYQTKYFNKVRYDIVVDHVQQKKYKQTQQALKLE